MNYIITIYTIKGNIKERCMLRIKRRNCSLPQYFKLNINKMLFNNDYFIWVYEFKCSILIGKSFRCLSEQSSFRNFEKRAVFVLLNICPTKFVFFKILRKYVVRVFSQRKRMNAYSKFQEYYRDTNCEYIFIDVV